MAPRLRGPRPRRALRAVLVGAVLVGCAATSEARAYAGDTHYYLRYASALLTCFDWDEAHLIASSDYLVDKNRTTTAEKHPFKKHNKIHWHAFGRSEERYNELWEIVLGEEAPTVQLVRLGQFLHFVSDWESHYGYGTRMGHGIPTFLGRDPDSLANNRMNNLRMLVQTLRPMMRVCVQQQRDVPVPGEADRSLAVLFASLMDESLLDELHETGSRRWKSWGARGKKGREIRPAPLRRPPPGFARAIRSTGCRRPSACATTARGTRSRCSGWSCNCSRSTRGAT